MNDAGHESPADHDPADPQAGAHPVQNHVAGHFEEEVADEEDACAEAVDRFTEAQIVEHLQLGKSDVDAIEVGDQVAQHQERQEPPRDLAIGSFFRGRRRRWRFRRRSWCLYSKG